MRQRDQAEQGEAADLSHRCLAVPGPPGIAETRKGKPDQMARAGFRAPNRVQTTTEAIKASLTVKTLFTHASRHDANRLLRPPHRR